MLQVADVDSERMLPRVERSKGLTPLRCYAARRLTHAAPVVKGRAATERDAPRRLAVPPWDGTSRTITINGTLHRMWSTGGRRTTGGLRGYYHLVGPNPSSQHYRNRI
jgi:hypothetical protein